MTIKRKRRENETVALEMTPMIDVVFQLLIFFIVTKKEEDILSHLDVNRPAPDKPRPPEEKQDELLDIIVWEKGYVMKGRKVAIEEVERQLGKYSSISKNVSVVIKCEEKSPHSYLVKVLDICSKKGLKNLNVFSL